MSMSNDELKRQLNGIDGVEYVHVEGDEHHYHVTIVSDVFENKSRVARQQWVYAVLNHAIVSGDLHAIHMKTWTTSEWEKHHG